MGEEDIHVGVGPAPSEPEWGEDGVLRRMGDGLHTPMRRCIKGSGRHGSYCQRQEVQTLRENTKMNADIELSMEVLMWTHGCQYKQTDLEVHTAVPSSIHCKDLGAVSSLCWQAYLD